MGSSRAAPSRWTVLALAFITLFGPYYCFDNPASNLNALKHRFGVPSTVVNGTTPQQREEVAQFNVNYGLLYSLYSFPNMVLPFVSGVLIDTFGIPRMVMFLVTLASVGQLLFTGGTYFKAWWLMLLGRVVYGAGCESLYVTQSTILSQWFRGQDVSLALASLVVSSRSASVVNSVVGPTMPSPEFAFLVGFILCVVSWLSAFYLVRIYQRHSDESTPLLDVASLNVVIDETPDGAVAKDGTAPALSWSEYFGKIYSDLRRLPRPFWVVCVVCCFGFSSVGSLSDIAPAYLTHHNALTHTTQSQQVQNLEFACMNGAVIVFAPLAGRLADKLSCYKSFMWVGMACICGLFVMGASDDALTPMPAMVGASVSLAFFASGIWPLVSLLVPLREQGTAFGVFVAVQNLGSSASVAVVSAMQPPRCGATYRCCNAILAATSGLSAAFALFVTTPPPANATIDVVAGLPFETEACEEDRGYSMASGRADEVRKLLHGAVVEDEYDPQRPRMDSSASQTAHQSMELPLQQQQQQFRQQWMRDGGGFDGSRRHHSSELFPVSPRAYKPDRSSTTSRRQFST